MRNETNISVRVSWQAVEDAVKYTVRFTKTKGPMKQQGPCTWDIHTVSVDTSELSVVVDQTSEGMLRPFTTYDVTVIAKSMSSKSEPSDSVRFTTQRTSECDVLSYCNFNFFFL